MSLTQEKPDDPRLRPGESRGPELPQIPGSESSLPPAFAGMTNQGLLQQEKRLKLMTLSCI